MAVTFIVEEKRKRWSGRIEYLSSEKEFYII